MSLRKQAAARHFAFQSAEDFEIFFLTGESEELQEEFSFGEILRMKADDYVEVNLGSTGAKNYKILVSGSEEEVNEFRNSYQQRENPTGYVSLAMFRKLETEFESMKADYMKDYGAFQERIDAMDERVQAMEKAKRVVPYKRRSRNEIGLLEVVLDDPDDSHPLKFYFNNTKKLYEYIRKNKKPFFSITHKYGIDIESQLSYLADFIRKNLNDPSRCGYVVAIQFLSLDEFRNSFLPTNKDLTGTRNGRNSKKDVFNKSFQSLFKDILRWGGAHVFTPDAWEDWILLAVDGVNSRVDNFNSVKKQKLRISPNSAEFWPTLAHCNAWHERLVKASGSVAVPVDEDESVESMDVSMPTSVEPDPHHFNTPF